ncbi:MAG: zinc ribbon domain-containing protein [Methanobrevibacter sp.]|nr:zinc ribbon domain-containing protein [Methanobrevibacter sp.]
MEEKIRCPNCNRLNGITKTCSHCGGQMLTDEQIKLIRDNPEPYCLNCGRPVEVGQAKCECGYEFADVKCPECGEINEYTNRFCTDCGIRIWNSLAAFPQNPPKGCILGDKLILDSDFLKRELVKTPHQIDGEINAGVLRSHNLRHDKLIDEICSRWWIVSPINCISCNGVMDAFENVCPQCNIVHHVSDDKNVLELKSIKDNYVKPERDVNELSKLKWTYVLSEDDLGDYFLSLAPMIGESQGEYRQRLFREYGENCVISFLIQCEWNIYFGDNCIGCGGEFEKYRLDCPSCGMKKNVPALSVLYNDDNVEIEAFAGQFDDFSRCVTDVCRDNGADISHIDEGIAQCPQCQNYFHYLTPDFMDSQKCPHCGVHFDFNATIFQDEWDYAGIPYDEYMETYYGVKR